MMMQRIYTEFSWDFTLKSQTVSFAAGIATAQIASDYLRNYHAQWIDTSVTPNQYNALQWEEYPVFIQTFDPGRTAHKPEKYSISPELSMVTSGSATISTAQINIYPTFATASSIKLTYYSLPVDLGTAGVPAFPDHAFLVDGLVNELYRYMRDNRYEPRFIDAFVARYRRNLPDSGIGGVQRVRLAPGVFRKRWSERLY